MEFFGGPVVKNMPVNAGYTRLIPRPGWSHMPQGNEHKGCNYWAHMPQLLNPECPSTRGLQREKPLQGGARALSRGAPLTAAGEKPWHSNEDPERPER